LLCYAGWDLALSEEWRGCRRAIEQDAEVDVEFLLCFLPNYCLGVDLQYPAMHASSKFPMFPILLHNESFVSLHVLVAYRFIDMNIEWEECTMQNAVEKLNILL
jgi:hypothetical protein